MIYLVYFVIVFAILFFVYFEWQKSVVFHPRYYRDMSLYDESYTFLTLKEGDVTLEGCVYEPKDPKGSILYFGGRGQDSVGLLPKLAEQLPSLRIVTFNYRGYGKSEGKPTETILLQDSVRITQKIQKRYGKITVVGYSLGGSVASYAASNIKVDNLVLIGAMCSLDSIVKEKYGIKLPFLRYHFFTCKYLKTIETPVSLFISKDDNVVPYSEAKKLKEIIKHLKIYKEFEKLNHVELLWEDEVLQSIEKIV